MGYKYNLFFVLVFVLFSCGNGNSKVGSKNEKISISSKNDTALIIEPNFERTFTFSASCLGEELVHKESMKGARILDLLRILHISKNKIAIAYEASLDKQCRIPLRVVIDESIDTTLLVPIQPKNIPTQFSIEGKCAPLISKADDPNLEVDVKKWFFNNKEHESEYIRNKTIEVYKALISSVYTQYVTNAPIPFLRDFYSNTYKVQSSMNADHYVLFALSDEKELKPFVENIVSNDFNLTTTSLAGQIYCHGNIDEEGYGYKCIVLIGINDDWSYQVQPLGLVCIDNVAPVINRPAKQKDYADIILKKCNAHIVLPDRLTVAGTVSIDTKEFRGNDALFELLWEGDVKSVSIIRQINSSYSLLKPATKTIYLLNKSKPYYFRFSLDLGVGDNYIPIIATDYTGNNCTYRLHIPMESVEDNNPDINIDNNINL